MGNTKSKRQPRTPSKPDLVTSNGSSNAPKQTQTAPAQNPSTRPGKEPSKSHKGSGKEDNQAFSAKRLEEIFNKYKDDDDDDDDQTMGTTGMEKFCSDLELDPDDVVTLVIAYHLKARQMGSFTKEEFMKGFEQLGLDTLDKMRKYIPKFRNELDDPSIFKNIYRFAFDFSKEPQQKCLDLEIAQALISLLLVERYPLASSFLEFLKQQDSYKGLNVDQWTSLLEFCKAIDPSFANYDENGAWPCVLDEWVTWVKEKKEEATEAS